MHTVDLLASPLCPLPDRAVVHMRVVPIADVKMALCNSDVPLAPVLLVEECAADLYLTHARLAADGVRNPVIVARELLDAVRILEAVIRDPLNQPLPIVMFTDLKLLWSDGLDLIKWVKTQPQLDQMTVIVLTGSVDPAQRKAAMALGADGYLAKFPDDGVFAAIVAEATWSWQPAGLIAASSM